MTVNIQSLHDNELNNFSHSANKLLHATIDQQKNSRFKFFQPVKILKTNRPQKEMEKLFALSISPTDTLKFLQLSLMMIILLTGKHVWGQPPPSPLFPWVHLRKKLFISNTGRTIYSGPFETSCLHGGQFYRTKNGSQ